MHLTEARSIVAAISDRVSRRGSAEREWFADWNDEFAAATAAGDEAECALLLDALVAFDAWQRSQHPASLRR